ncbi:MAG: hypothetical protein KIH69_007630 [Anaerolineae bacterium]|nr:hypothetical protein [Anaerolineae bacterium]
MEQNTSRNSFWAAVMLVLMLALASGVSANKAAQNEGNGVTTTVYTAPQL